MPYSHASMTNPFVGLPLGKGVLNRAAQLNAAIRPGAFTPYQPQQTIPALPRASAAAPTPAPAPAASPVRGDGGNSAVAAAIAGGASIAVPTTGGQVLTTPFSSIPPGFDLNNLLPGARSMAEQGHQLPSYMFFDPGPQPASGGTDYFNYGGG